MRRINASSSGGFTIVELLIATAVFSTVLLLSLTGFLQIGQLFYKGVSLTQTQQTAKDIMDSLSNDLSAGDGSPVTMNPKDSTRTYFCIGGNRYSFMLHHEVSLATESLSKNLNDFGLVKDTIPSGGGCADPFASGAGSYPFNNPSELLGDHMRLSKLAIVSPVGSSGLYNVEIRVAYGDDSVLQNPLSDNATCDSRLSQSQFCSVTDLVKTVTKGF